LAENTRPFDLILASASPRRQLLLAHLGIPFSVEPSAVIEELAAEANGVTAARHLALAKAVEVSLRYPQSLVIGADTVVVFEGRILGKPVDAEEATATLTALRDRWHDVITAVAVVQPLAQASVEHVTTRVRMRDYSDVEVEAYIASGKPLDKAGAYGIQDEDFHPVAEYDGCYCNVMGLPLWTTAVLLSRAGLSVTSVLERMLEACRVCPYRFSAK
jgi:MAF protein